MKGFTVGDISSANDGTDRKMVLIFIKETRSNIWKDYEYLPKRDHVRSKRDIRTSHGKLVNPYCMRHGWVETYSLYKRIINAIIRLIS